MESVESSYHLSVLIVCFFFFFSSRRRHTRYWRDWSSDVCSSDLMLGGNHHRVDPHRPIAVVLDRDLRLAVGPQVRDQPLAARSEERRVGKECRSRWSAYHVKTSLLVERTMGKKGGSWREIDSSVR